MIESSYVLTKPFQGVVGHRGVATHAPENTLSSIKLAKSMGISWIEIDVRLTKGGEPIVFHDSTLERTTNGRGRVSAYHLPHLKSLDAGLWFSHEFKNEKIPSLFEALELIALLELSVNLEIKCPLNTNVVKVHAFARTIHETITKVWPISKPIPLVSSFNVNFLHAYRQYSNNAPIGVLSDRITNRLCNLVKSIPNCTLHCGKQDLTKELVKEIVLSGVTLLIYTINDRDIGLAFLEAGAFAIFSDRPEVFL